MIEWTEWSGALPIEKQRRDEWAARAVEKVQHEGLDSMDISSGDTVVIALRRSGRIWVYDCVIRREGEVK